MHLVLITNESLASVFNGHLISADAETKVSAFALPFSQHGDVRSSYFFIYFFFYPGQLRTVLTADLTPYGDSSVNRRLRRELPRDRRRVKITIKNGEAWRGDGREGGRVNGDECLRTCTAAPCRREAGSVEKGKN